MGFGQYDSSKHDHCQRNSNKSTTRKADEYDAHDYDDPEVFYEDHYDDFWDHEDAEDYWKENILNIFCKYRLNSL